MNLFTKLITSKFSMNLLKKYAKYKQSSVIIATKDKTIHIQKNGSVIQSLPASSENVRGRRAEFINFYDDFDLDVEELEEAIKPLVKRQ